MSKNWLLQAIAAIGMLTAPVAWAKPGFSFQMPSGVASRLLGMVAFGQAESIDKLEAEAISLGFKTARPKTDDGRIELMIFFVEGSTRENALLIKDHAESGEIGKFEIEYITIPESAVK